MVFLSVGAGFPRRLFSPYPGPRGCSFQIQAPPPTPALSSLLLRGSAPFPGQPLAGGTGSGEDCQ